MEENIKAKLIILNEGTPDGARSIYSLMMNLRKSKYVTRILFFYCLSYILASCGIYINDDGYKFLSYNEKSHVMPLSGSINEIKNDGNIYKINVAQMQDFLRSHDKVIIYEYLSFCTSDHCLLPSAIEEKCTKYGITMCIVLESYANAFEIPKMQSPLLIVDKDNYTKKRYCTQFFNELTGTTYKTRGYGRYYFFKYGKYVKCIDDITKEDFSLLY